MIVAQQADNVADEVKAGVDADDVPAADAEPTSPSPPPTTAPPPPQELPSTSHAPTTVSMDLLQNLLETCTALTRRVKNLEQDKIAQALEILKLKKKVRKLEMKKKLKASGLKRLQKVRTNQRIESSADTIMDDQEDASKQREIIANIDADEDVTLKDVAAVAKEVKVKKDADVHGRPEESQAQIYKMDLEHADKVLSMQDDVEEPAELQEVIEVVTTAKLMTEVVTAATTTITAAAPITAATITAAPKQVKGKGKQDNDVLRYHALKKKPQTEAQARKNMIVYLKNMAGFKMDYFKRMSYDDIRLIFEKYCNSNVAFLEKTKKQKLDEEVEELKKHLQIVPNDDDVYTEAIPLALNVPVIVQERFSSSKPKNFSDDFLLTTLTYMFEKPDVEAQVWKNQRSVHGLAKVKSWRLLESCGVHIITFITTQMILLVERRYPLTRFTLDQILNNTSKIYSKGLRLLVEDLLLMVQIDAAG
nr:hypothetical protein [Tanacetum cinerariifolium]